MSHPIDMNAVLDRIAVDPGSYRMLTEEAVIQLDGQIARIRRAQVRGLVAGALAPGMLDDAIFQLEATRASMLAACNDEQLEQAFRGLEAFRQAYPDHSLQDLMAAANASDPNPLSALAIVLVQGDRLLQLLREVSARCRARDRDPRGVLDALMVRLEALIQEVMVLPEGLSPREGIAWIGTCHRKLGQGFEDLLAFMESLAPA